MFRPSFIYIMCIESVTVSHSVTVSDFQKFLLIKEFNNFLQYRIFLLFWCDSVTKQCDVPLVTYDHAMCHLSLYVSWMAF
jgi:hypothetical protein